jgi:hypothetical protein
VDEIMKIPLTHNNEQGIALVISLMFLALLSILGTTAYVMTGTDLKIGRNYQASAESFFDAEAGVNFAEAGIESALNSGSITLPTTIGGTATLTYTVPSGFSFSLSPITLIANNTYSLTSTGNGPNNSQAQIVVRYSRASAINFAAFGDKKLDTKNGGTTLSFDSSSTDPTKNDPLDPSFQTTHEADVGSNDWLVTHNGASIDGAGVLGEKVDGSATTNSIHSGTTFYDTSPENVGRVDPDPLGVNIVGGAFNPATYAPPYNDNLTGINPISMYNSATQELEVPNNQKVTLTTGDFYFSKVELKNNAELEVNASGGEVRVFLTGPFDSKNSSRVDVIGNPTDFSIFSNSTDKIDFKNGSEFKGFVYGPYADINVKNGGDVYGAIWGGNVDIKNSGTLYFDTAIRNKFLSNNLSKVSWCDVRN